MKYVGITVGPILETIAETTKPAGLWFASSIFSDITRRLCVEIQDERGLKGEILSPYFDENENLQDGVGKYHDRIVFKTEKYEKSVLDDIVTKVKKDTIHQFPTDEKTAGEEIKFLMDYLQINYVVIDENNLAVKNSILALSPYLDAIELMKNIPQTQENNPFGWLFKGKKEISSNSLITKSGLFKNVEKNANQLCTDNGSIRDIEKIAMGFNENSGNLKKSQYFATISADGDGMGAFLNSLETDEDVKLFSKTCLDYDKQAAELIGRFGGMTIYAGGDDLLFLAPLEGLVDDRKQTIFSLCSEINAQFNSIVKEAFSDKANVLEKIPTISFGVAIRYYKYPLYEALSNARELLDYVKTRTRKNAIAVQLEKHSGQTLGLVIPHDSVSVVNRILETDISRYSSEKSEGDTNKETDKYSDEEKVKRVIYTLENMKTLIQVLDKQGLDEEKYWGSWKNFFDNSSQAKNEKFHKSLCKAYYNDFLKPEEKKIKSMSEHNDDDYEPLLAFTMLLRLEKFMKEQKGNQE